MCQDWRALQGSHTSEDEDRLRLFAPDLARLASASIGVNDDQQVGGPLRLCPDNHVDSHCPLLHQLCALQHKRQAFSACAAMGSDSRAWFASLCCYSL